MITVNELFSGIGAQNAGLERLGIPHNIVGIAEIDKYAIKSYEAIHGPTRNYGDISKIDKLDYADFWTYSFPCQDISVAGKQRGITEETRSGLLYQVERLLEKSIAENEAPKWLMLENVKNLVGKKFKPDFDRWIQKLDKLGYNTYWKVLNAKDYGIPQNRERVFAISIRKDIDTGYAFPQPFELTIRLKDILEPEVDEKYYIDGERVQKLITKAISSEYRNDKATYEPFDNAACWSLGSQEFVRTGFMENMPTLTARDYKDPRCVVVEQLGNISECNGKWDNPQTGRIYSTNGCAPTLNTCGGCGHEPKILEPVIVASRGRNPDNPSDRTTGAPTEQRLEINQNGTSNTITTVQKDNYVVEPLNFQNCSNYSACEFALLCEKSDHCVREDNSIKEPSGLYTNDSERFHHGPLLGLSRCLKANKHDASVMIPQATKQGYIECKVGGVADLSFPSSNTRRGRVQDSGNICPTLMAGQQDVCYIEPTYRIRKLTPLECWRLMGFTDEQFYKAQAVNSNSQLYKQAGNSIVVDVLYWIFYQLFVNENKQQVIEEQGQLAGQMNIFDFIGG